ncbi:hypothetical protein WT27_23800 [Burkholderia territorii]|uniref:Uncharacterized protein n=1 Tax=Burkholderia territorii TaxID=1503055 RepID=A0A106EG15_9BURK|nr:hypothetical protein [Burkholderia territorii]KVV57957.1 hypothetical protein WT27_23800 [Burkholderia territorii]KVX46856.1 hypothetical protein WT31_21470 [Burkholderia territorii]
MTEIEREEIRKELQRKLASGNLSLLEQAIARSEAMRALNPGLYDQAAAVVSARVRSVATAGAFGAEAKKHVERTH